MNDDIIIDLFWERSESAIMETGKKYGGFCRKIAFNILNNIQDAEECENDAYNAVWNAIPPSRPNSFKVFLGRIVRNISLSKYDYNTAKKRNHHFDAILSELEDVIASSQKIEAIYENHRLCAAINAFLSKLDKHKRIIFVRRYWYGDSISDIASLLQMSDSGVKSALLRTRNKLKLHLDKEDISL